MNASRSCGVELDTALHGASAIWSDDIDFLILNKSTGAKPVKSIAEMVVDPIIAEHDDRWELDALAHRFSVFSHHLCRGPAFALLNGRVGQDRSHGNAANFACGLGLAVWFHA
jgi:hypothetical protein